MKRLTLFAKGNLDVRDSLHSLRLAGELRWNGINALLRERGAPLTTRVRHETSVGSAVLAHTTGTIPAVFAGRTLELEAYPLETQLGGAIYTARADVYVLSVQPDVQMDPVRHRREGFVFHPRDLSRWSEEDLAWLRAEFETCGPAEPDAALADFATVIERLRAATDAPILVYNMSSLVPGETVHCHAGMEDILSTRIKRFNLGLIELSQATGISIVDVERVVASHGVAAMKFDTTHFTEAGCRAVATEVLRVLADYGFETGAEDA